MQCQEVEARLSDYIEQTLDGAATALVTAHVQACESCNELALTIRRTIVLCNALPKAAPSEALVAQIVQSIPPRGRFWFDLYDLRHAFRIVLSPRFGMAVVLVFFFISFIGNSYNTRFIAHAYSELSRSSEKAIRKADIVTHTFYSRIVKINDKRTQIQAELRFYATSLWNRIDYQLNQINEQYRIPTAEPKRRDQSGPSEQKTGVDLFSV